MNELVINRDGKVCTSSRMIAQKFNKRHSDVIRSITSLECSDDFRERNFALSQYISELPTGGTKELPEYMITRDGFSFLVMGFTGKKAAQFKEEFINAFNKMEAQLISKPMSKEQLWLQALTSLTSEVERQKEQLKLAHKTIANQQPKVDFVDRVFDNNKLVDFGQCAKILDLPFGRNTLFQKLREKGILFQSKNEPMQRYINQRLFVLKQKTIQRSFGEQIVTKVLITQKGLYFIKSLFDSGSQLDLIPKTPVR